MHKLPAFDSTRSGTPIEHDRQGMGRIVPARENACGVWNRFVVQYDDESSDAEPGSPDPCGRGSSQR
ncbi:hypothetical protein [Haladaptatus halobius]|uniref:hypothetical protein n=1 Tax=Haladaptatus halobius TaxID=2884875 RepID=UPI001D0AE938|nr:hypothetical protein [Haladaptatus halobius]